MVERGRNKVYQPRALKPLSQGLGVDISLLLTEARLSQRDCCSAQTVLSTRTRVWVLSRNHSTARQVDITRSELSSTELPRRQLCYILLLLNLLFEELRLFTLY